MAIKTESVIASIHPKQSKNTRLKFIEDVKEKQALKNP